MIKLLSAVAITAASILPIGEAKAASTWDAYVAQRACTYLRQGETAYNAGYRGAQDVLGTRYESAFMRDVLRYGEDYVGQAAVLQMLSICPEALLNAS